MQWVAFVTCHFKSLPLHLGQTCLALAEFGWLIESGPFWSVVVRYTQQCQSWQATCPKSLLRRRRPHETHRDWHETEWKQVVLAEAVPLLERGRLCSSPGFGNVSFKVQHLHIYVSTCGSAVLQCLCISKLRTAPCVPFCGCQPAVRSCRRTCWRKHAYEWCGMVWGIAGSTAPFPSCPTTCHSRPGGFKLHVGFGHTVLYAMSWLDQVEATFRRFGGCVAHSLWQKMVKQGC